jgi:hypothetical protein
MRLTERYPPPHFHYVKTKEMLERSGKRVGLYVKTRGYKVKVLLSVRGVGGKKKAVSGLRSEAVSSVQNGVCDCFGDLLLNKVVVVPREDTTSVISANAKSDGECPILGF